MPSGSRSCRSRISAWRATRVAGPDRRGVERLCRYGARPALASGRLRLLDSQQLPSRSKHRGRMGPVTCSPLRWNCWRSWEKYVLNGLIEYRIGPATGPQTTKPYCEPCQTTCKRSSASLPCPLGVFGALTRGPKRCLILPILYFRIYQHQ